jgi:NitT/TauT family transport system ATP-binding protein
MGKTNSMSTDTRPDAPGARPILRLAGISFSYPGSRDFTVKNVSFEVREREIVALLGESGCGKSTLLNLAGGLLAADHGQVSFRGEKISSTPPGISIVFQEACLLPWLNVAANVAFALSFRSLRLPRAERKKRVSDVLREVGMEEAAEKYPAQLSGGMAQRVALARSLARRAELILLDEPFSSLDAITRVAMQELLLRIVFGHNSSALLVTHDLDEALLVADRLLLMAGSAGGTEISEWKLSGILGGAAGACPGERRRHFRSSAFMDLRDEISAKLAGSADIAGLENASADIAGLESSLENKNPTITT